ncbi:dethiobiotin synthase [Staphylococcus gallinarum]|uniref:dethiobiotin synthase n=1 Tax=Staphylococcus gallinarum TaxID=1293 RepID=UPI002FBDB6C3|nr:dethiobiotin synthase [Staphylococcus gallinarum]
MNIFITGTNTDIGKTYVTTQLFNLLQNAGKSVVIFKPFQTEEIGLGCYPDLEVYKNVCGLGYEETSLYTFRDPVSPHLAFKLEPNQRFSRDSIITKLAYLEQRYDYILIEGAGGIAVPIYENNDYCYMTSDLIRDTADFIVSVVPSKLGAISDVIVHQSYLEQCSLPTNVIIMNHFSNTAIEQDNKHTLEKLLSKAVFTCESHKQNLESSKQLLAILEGAINDEQ